MYTWSEVKRLILIQEAMPLKVKKKRDTQKARTNEEHHQDVTQWVIKGRGGGRSRNRSSICKRQVCINDRDEVEEN